MNREGKIKDFLLDYSYDEVSHYKPKKSDILIINNCSKSKDKSDDLLKAIDRYKGSEIKYINDIHDITDFDHYIISAKYGLISSEELIPYYNKTFLDLTHKERKMIASKLHIREDLDNLIKRNNYKMIIVILADVYLDLLELENPFETDSLIFHFTVKNCKNIFKGNNIISVPLNPEITLPQFKKYIRVNLKAGIIKELFNYYPNLDFMNNPKLIRSFIENYE